MSAIPGSNACMYWCMLSLLDVEESALNCWLIWTGKVQCSICNSADIGSWAKQVIAHGSCNVTETCIVCSWHRHGTNNICPCNCSRGHPGADCMSEGSNADVNLQLDAGTGQHRVCPADHGDRSALPVQPGWCTSASGLQPCCPTGSCCVSFRQL